MKEVEMSIKRSVVIGSLLSALFKCGGAFAACMAQVAVGSTMAIGVAGGSSDQCLIEPIDCPTSGQATIVNAFDFAPAGTFRTIWNGACELIITASPTPNVANYIGLPSVSNMTVAPLDMVEFVSMGTYGMATTAWQLVARTPYQSPGEIPGTTRGLGLTVKNSTTARVTAQYATLCDAGGHCIQQFDADVTVNFAIGIGAGGIDTGLLEPGIWYIYIIEAPQGPSAIASLSSNFPTLPTPTSNQNMYAWAGAVAVATISSNGTISQLQTIPAH